MKAIKKVISTLLCTVVVASLFAISSPVVFAESTNLVINEICSSNKGNNGNITSSTNKDGSFCDWVEIYNKSANEQDLSGWGLSDGKSDYYKFAFPSGTKIAPNSFLIVYCSKSFVGESTDLCAAFGISSDGEKIYLTSKDGTQQDMVDSPAMLSDTTYGRYPDGSAEFKLLAPTPLKSNAQSVSVSVAEPVFSKESGMYEDGFSLKISCAESNVDIYYTTDGSDPATSKTRILYTNEITVHDRTGEPNVLAAVNPDDVCISYSGSQPSDNDVDKGTVIRATVVNSKQECSKTITKSYFVGDAVCSYGDIPILSVTTDFDNLFGYEKGIYCNGKVWADFQKTNPGVTQSWLAQTNSTQRGREWERDCHIDLIESDNSVSLSQDCGVRTQGGSSRTSLQKSLRFFARKEYGNSYFEAPLIPSAIGANGKVIDKYKTFIVRNGGNDSTYLKFTDNYIQNLVKDRDVATQQGRGVLVFLDGEYWGVFILQEDYTENYFKEKYGVDSNDVAMIKCGEAEIGEQADVQSFIDMCDYVVATGRPTAEQYAEICEMMDIQSFMEYMAIELYICNADWPNNNWAAWRTISSGGEGYSDGKWRFVLYDTEYSTAQYGASNTSASYNNFELAFNYNLGQGRLISLFWYLSRNAEFKKQFVKTTLDLVNTNFESLNAVEAFYNDYDYYYNHLVDYRKRFHNSSNYNLSSRSNQISSFFARRNSCIIANLASEAKLKASNIKFTLTSSNSKAGEILLNSSTVDLSNYSRGKLVCNYLDSIDTTLTAVAKDGFVFKKWSGAVTTYDKTITLNAENYGDVKAEFVAKNELVYGDVTDDGKFNTADVLALRKRLANFSIELFDAVADVNVDGVINVKDVLLLRKKLAGFDVQLGE